MAATVVDPILKFVVFGILFIPGAIGSTIEDDGLTDSSFYVAFAVISLVCFIALVALCGGSEVTAARPVPPWVLTIQVDPNIDTGITGSSDGFTITSHNTLFRHRKGGWEADGAKWGAPLAKGKHVFEIHWPRIFRGQTATVGVGNSSALMFIKPKDSLIGCNGNSWGLDISRRKLIHRGEMTGSMPRGMIPEKFFMYVDCDSGTLGFGSELEYWGAPFNISRHNFPVFAMVGCTCPNSQLTMIYRGSEVKAQMGPVNTVVVPAGSVVTTVVNTNVGQHQQGYNPVGQQKQQGYDPVGQQQQQGYDSVEQQQQQQQQQQGYAQGPVPPPYSEGGAPVVSADLEQDKQGAPM